MVRETLSGYSLGENIGVRCFMAWVGNKLGFVVVGMEKSEQKKARVVWRGSGRQMGGP